MSIRFGMSLIFSSCNLHRAPARLCADMSYVARKVIPDKTAHIINSSHVCQSIAVNRSRLMNGPITRGKALMEKMMPIHRPWLTLPGTFPNIPGTTFLPKGNATSSKANKGWYQ